MTAHERRLRLLAQLAWDLRVLRRTTMVVVKSYGEPVLYVPLNTGDHLAIMVIEGKNGRLFYSWGRKTQVEATKEAASKIAAVAACRRPATSLNRWLASPGPGLSGVANVGTNPAPGAQPALDR